MHYLLELKEGLIISFMAIRANKMRSVLTTLGIVIGIVSVTLMATAIEGVNRAFDKSAAAFGTDVLYVQKFPWMSNEDWATIRNRPNLKVSDATRIERQARLIDAVAPVLTTRRRTSYGDNSMENAFVTGTTYQYINASGNVLEDGRFFTVEESNGGRPVCVVGAVVAETLFPAEDPIGKSIRVVGFQSKFGSRRRWVTIQVKVADLKEMEDAKIELEGIMRNVRRLPPGKPNNFNINQQEILTATFAPISLVIATIGLFITGLSLFVGGIGIMNIMFVSVTERTKEIGIRKAIGAKRRTILMQFLTEAAALCLIGGLIGLIIAFPLSLVVDSFLPTAMPLSVVFIAITISLAVGVISGFMPAFRAARMDPVEALRHE
jgi:putative ABC transport system permease protein